VFAVTGRLSKCIVWDNIVAIVKPLATVNTDATVKNAYARVSDMFIVML
jgi:hypothetical protein